MTPTGRLGAVVAVLVVLLGAACGTAPEFPAAAGVGLSGSVMQYRSEIARRVLTVRVRAAAPIDVRGLVVRPAGFEPAEPVATEAALGAGNSVDVRATYGAARCDMTPTGAGDALVDVVRDGRESRVQLPLEDTYGQIALLHATECAERAVRSQVEFSYPGGWAADSTGQVLRGTLQLRDRRGARRRGARRAGAIRLHQLRGSALGQGRGG